ncbi:SagB/ThcOx family dehydrogenase [Natranaerobius thermophilus]|uniref:Nitroreductase n=1 Tax=Natranaerobius thermophilus (strain ATCC BAA-1301 / DSM 18059 / JW/NM-WN-LF) TaxID=457570 RepID=B2A6P8_NATTJ|nr:SagB/ThcOx family dehydrogenase [Natranaerobius thermophilus]ACB84181.1 nitroreductase [Natranaerobius thermophilus JW/NM-WN-LF]
MQGNVLSRSGLLVLGLTILLIGGLTACQTKESQDRNTEENFNNDNNIIELSSPNIEGDLTIEEAIEERRSVRSYQEEGLSEQELSQLLWAAQGITDKNRNYRAAPSAGATFPMEIFVLVEQVEGLASGVYHYLPEKHSLKVLKSEDEDKSEELSQELMKAALGQDSIGEAPVNIIIAAVYDRVTAEYGEVGYRYGKMEAGHISQNIYLQSQGLDLGTVAIGAFHQDSVSNILELSQDTEPLYIMPVGKLD